MIKYSEKGNFPEWKLKMKIYSFNSRFEFLHSGDSMTMSSLIDF